MGTVLARHLHAAGHEVIVLSRRLCAAPWRVIVWDGDTAGDWMDAFEGADVVANLAGKTVNCRYTAANRAEIKASRVQSTRAVGRAIVEASRPPRVWLQASTATIYSTILPGQKQAEISAHGGDYRDRQHRRSRSPKRPASGKPCRI